MIRIILTSVVLVIVLFGKAQISDTAYIHVDGIELYTVLTVPENSMNTSLAIIVAGSGPTDLDGNQPQMKNNSLLFLSEALVKRNIATLRYDKRAIAKSAYSGFKESDLNIDQYANDLVKLIKNAKERGYKDVFIIGYSEGSLIGLIAAQQESIKGFISVSGPANSADVILKNQLRPQLPPEMYSKVESIIDSLKAGYLVKNTPPMLAALFRSSVQPYLISWMKYEPADLIGKLNCTVLIVQGDKDLQVSPEEAKLLYESSKGAELVVVNNMNHILKTILGDIQENKASYVNPGLPVNSDIVEAIAKFINN